MQGVCHLLGKTNKHGHRRTVALAVSVTHHSCAWELLLESGQTSVKVCVFGLVRNLPSIVPVSLVVKPPYTWGKWFGECKAAIGAVTCAHVRAARTNVATQYTTRAAQCNINLAVPSGFLAQSALIDT